MRAGLALGSTAQSCTLDPLELTWTLSLLESCPQGLSLRLGPWDLAWRLGSQVWAWSLVSRVQPRAWGCRSQPGTGACLEAWVSGY